MAVDEADIYDLMQSFGRINALIESKVFDSSNRGHVLQESAFIELMILLRDLAEKGKKYGHPLTLTDDVQVNDYVKDLHDLIVAIRDSCCHNKTFKRRIEGEARGAYLIIYGKAVAGRIGDTELRSDYEDDIAVYYGNNRIYLRRHVIRAFRELESFFSPGIESFWSFPDDTPHA